jgi:hypothetical protein
MKYVIAVIVALIALPILFGILNMVIGTAFMVIKLLIALAVLVLLAGLVLRLMGGIAR